MLRLIRWTASVLVVLVAAFWGVVWLAQMDPNSHAARLLDLVTARAGQGAAPPASGTDGAFTLVDPRGRIVTDRTFRGKWMLVYFGYTYCPDICPTTLQTISNVLDQLGDQARQIVPIFITVDPDRDTPAVMGDYVALFDPRLIGLTGSEEQIALAKSDYGVFSRRIPASQTSDYMIDHSSYVYFMGPDGKLKTLFKAAMTETDMVAAIRETMAE